MNCLEVTFTRIGGVSVVLDQVGGDLALSMAQVCDVSSSGTGLPSQGDEPLDAEGE